MKVNVTMADSLFEEYVKKFGIPGCYAAMRRAIETFKDFDEKNDRYLLLHGKHRQEIEAVFQTTLDTPDKLAKLVKNLSIFKIGDVTIDFTTDELARLSMQATFHGSTLDAFVKNMASELKARMLEQV